MTTSLRSSADPSAILMLGEARGVLGSLIGHAVRVGMPLDRVTRVSEVAQRLGRRRYEVFVVQLGVLPGGEAQAFSWIRGLRRRMPHMGVLVVASPEQRERLGLVYEGIAKVVSDGFSSDALVRVLSALLSMRVHRRGSTTRHVVDRRRVLVIEDSMTLRRVYERALLAYQGADIEVCYARNAHEALGLLQRGQAMDLILLDVRMPAMGGLAFLEISQRLAWLQSVPVVVVASGESDEGLLKAMRLGARAGLMKPFRLGALYEVMDKLLGASASEALTQPQASDVSHA